MQSITDNSYGIINRSYSTNQIEIHTEEIKIQGYTIIPKLFNADELEKIRRKIDYIYSQQVEELTLEDMIKCNELDTARCLLAYDKDLISIALLPKILELVEKFLGKYFILHGQNAVINQPKRQHHQTAWHRDLPYQDFVISTPLALTALYCIDDFTKETGATFLIPFSQKIDHMPSDNYIANHAKIIEASAGSVLVFDSMLFHRAGINTSNQIRRGITHVFTIPLIKQQICIPTILGNSCDLDSNQMKILGFGSKSSSSVTEYRKQRLQK